MNLRTLATLITMVVIAACTNMDAKSIANQRLSSKQTAEKPALKNIFSYASDCTKNKIDTRFCQCVEWAKDDSGKIPQPTSSMTEDEIIRKSVPVFFKYFEKLEQCEQFAPIALDTKIPENTEIANNVLIKYADRILTPELANEIQPIEQPIGWKYKLDKPNTDVDFSAGAFEYKGKEYDGDLFVYTGGMNSEYVYINGIRHFVYKKVTPYKLNPSEAGKCTFVLGECVYGPPEKRKKVFTKFEKGVWIRNIGATLRNRQIQKVIYDLNGIPLYELQQSTKYTFEKIRYESI